VDSVWKQDKLKARIMLENGDESHQSSARFVGRFLLRQTRQLKQASTVNLEIIMFVGP